MPDQPNASLIARPARLRNECTCCGVSSRRRVLYRLHGEWKCADCLADDELGEPQPLDTVPGSLLDGSAR